MKRGRKQTKFAPRDCACCGKPLVRRRYESGKLEDADRFDARHFCDLYCRAQYVQDHGWAAVDSLPAETRVVAS